jgi:hypothetical protein
LAVHGVVVPRHATGHPVCQFRQLRIRNDDRAGGAQVRHQSRIVRRHEIGEGECTARGAQILREEVVLAGNGNAVQRSAQVPLRALTIERVGFGQRARVTAMVARSFWS